jgi:hypothetical protein
MGCKDGVWTEELGSEFISFTEVGGIGVVNREGDVLELFVTRGYLRVRNGGRARDTDLQISQTT